MLGYGNEVLMLLFDIASLVNQIGGRGYGMNCDERVSIFGEYELTNDLSHNM